MANKTYKVKVSYTFLGEFDVECSSKMEAVAKVGRDCGALIGNVYDNNSDNVIDRDFPYQPHIRKILSVAINK